MFRKTGIIFDNDGATDDAAAFLYLLAIKAKILAVTIAGSGEAHGEQGAKNFSDLLYHFTGRQAIPIAYGQVEALGKWNPFPDFIRKLMDELLIGKEIKENPHRNISSDAVRLIAKTLSTTPPNEKVAILATGPLTNIAQFIQAYPDLVHKIEKIVIMGGALGVAGNIQPLDPSSDNTVAEWNLYADPKAASIVLYASVPILLVPLDATNQVPVTRAFYDSLRSSRSPAAQFVFKCCQDIVNKFNMELFLEHFYLWDQLAAMLCVSPELGVIKKMRVSFDPRTGNLKPSMQEGSPEINVVSVIKEQKKVLEIFTGQLDKLYCPRRESLYFLFPVLIAGSALLKYNPTLACVLFIAIGMYLYKRPQDFGVSIEKVRTCYGKMNFFPIISATSKEKETKCLDGKTIPDNSIERDTLHQPPK
jgi:inosine-uridine nucleoside N-ribohydrolase